MKANLVLFDEMAYVPEHTITTGAMPVTDLVGSSLIGISTPASRQNHFVAFTEKLDHNGEHVFDATWITHMCANCRKLPPKEAIKCKHLLFLLPPQKSPEDEEVTMALMADRPGDIMRERFGLAVDDSSGLLPAAQVRRMFSSTIKFSEIIYSPSVIVIGADPGYTKSDLALVAFGVFRDGYKVIGLAAYRNDEGPEVQYVLVRQFFHAIRKCVHFQSTPILFCPEAAPRGEASLLESQVRDISNVYTMHEVTGNHVGVPIFKETKLMYIIHMRSMLATNNMSVANFCAAFSNRECTIDGRKYGDDKLGYLLDLLARQLINLHPKVNMTLTRIDDYDSWTGKMPGEKDDLAMALMMAVYWFSVFESSPKPDYMRLKRKIFGQQERDLSTRVLVDKVNVLN